MGGGVGSAGLASSQTQYEQIGVTSMDFPEGESDKFFVGSDDFGIYQCNFHQSNDQHIT
jgi:hypothetical protein